MSTPSPTPPCLHAPHLQETIPNTPHDRKQGFHFSVIQGWEQGVAALHQHSWRGLRDHQSRDHDSFASAFADRNGVCVSFSDPVHDCAALAHAVLEAEFLPADKSKVAISGFSAGGCLFLGVVQLESSRGKFGGAVGLYLIVDFSRTTERKL
ncbi:hypothetical protein MMC12_001770 [Toensbergia leucococca]|nr:hypothetical protein [Toensbergia leucococca]